LLAAINHTTFDTIHTNYINETETYKEQLQNFLTTLSQITIDSTLTVHEIIELIANHHNQNATNYSQFPQLPSSTLKTFSALKLELYTEPSQIQKYIQEFIHKILFVFIYLSVSIIHSSFQVIIADNRLCFNENDRPHTVQSCPIPPKCVRKCLSKLSLRLNNLGQYLHWCTPVTECVVLCTKIYI